YTDPCRNNHLSYTVFLFGYAYIYKQTFAIPGSFFLNLLAGALFGVFVGSILVCILNPIGASGCFLLSAVFMQPIIDRFFLHRLLTLRRKVASERERLFLFLVGTRVLPFCPHWLLNICSPFMGVSLLMHATTILLGEFRVELWCYHESVCFVLGLIPYNVLCVRAGRLLVDLNTIHDVLDLQTIAELLAVAILLISIGFFSKRRQNNDDELQSSSTKS
ncbi:unnamed protein product, partial [Angiostrongylus costaricensis]|uniref:Golgi apparatus membrane protein TVP38 n=1 Tax=Angiostrongylus costaricensis TaxID=334426 RepID=A0A0R3PKB7_ANGCS